MQAEDDVIRSGILEITDKQSVVLLSAIAMAMDLQEDTAPTDKQALAMEVSGESVLIMIRVTCFGKQSSPPSASNSRRIFAWRPPIKRFKPLPREHILQQPSHSPNGTPSGGSIKTTAPIES